MANNEFLKIVVHIHKDGFTQVIGTQLQDGSLSPNVIARQYVQTHLNGVLPAGDQIAVRHIPVDKIVYQNNQFTCPNINANADILLTGE